MAANETAKGLFAKEDMMSEPIKIKYLSYREWCQKERLPQDRCSKAIYNHWKRSVPRLQRIIDNIAAGYLSQAHKDLGQYINAFRPDRFKSTQ